MKSNSSAKDFFNIRFIVLLLITFVSLMFYSTLSSIQHEKIAAQTQSGISQSKLSIFILDKLTPGADTILDAGPRVVKVIDYDPKDALEQQHHLAKMVAVERYKKKFPQGIAIIRFYPQNPIVFTVNDDPVQAAQSYFNQLDGRKLDELGTYKQYFDYITGPNEFEFNTGKNGSERFPLPWAKSGESATSQTVIARQKWQAKFWKKLTELNNTKGLKTCIFNIPSAKLGNGELKNMLPELDDMRRMGAAICYHEYKDDPKAYGTKQYYYTKFYDQFNEVSGQYPDLKNFKIIIGESGAKNWSSDSTGFQNYLKDFDSYIKSDSRVLGMTLFQIGSTNSVWDSSSIEPLSGWLADYIRGSGGGNSSPAPTSILPTVTSSPANCPTTSSENYDKAAITNLGDNLAAENHPDKNIQVRGYDLTNAERKLVHYDAGNSEDPKAPQLSTLLDSSTPAIGNLYKVYDWNWGSNGALGSKGSLLNNYPATLMGLQTNPGSSIYVPDSQYNVGGGHDAYVLYASENSITLVYLAEDRIIGKSGNGYGVHIDGICVDPNLLSLYKDLNSKGRSSLPILNGKQKLGTAKTSEVKVAVRDSGMFMDPRSDDWWLGISGLPEVTGIPTATPGGPTATPGGPTSPPGGSSPPATPKPGSCSTPTQPTFVTKHGTGAYPGKIKLEWNSAPGTKTYAIRIDDMTNGWKNDCSVAQFPGDICVDNVAGSATSYEFTGTESHSYHYWIHSINYCGEWSSAKDQIITVPPVGDSTTCRIQGYRTVQDDKYSDNLFPADAIKTLNISVTGGAVNSSYQFNPYYFVIEGGKTYTVTIPTVSGYATSSTYCVNNINCHGGTLTNPTLENGNTRTITCPAGGFADLWWHYLPTSVPTLSVPRPTATPGGANLTPTIAPPTPTVEFPSPTPSPCPAIEQLEWREGDRYERAVISYDGVNIIENISLHLKQITQSGLVVQVSTDGGTTWAPSDSSQNDDHFVTIKNRNTEVINLKVRLLNSCAVTSPELSQTIQTVPLPSISAAPTSKPSVTPGSSPMVPALILGGAALTAAAVAFFFFGI